VDFVDVFVTEESLSTSCPQTRLNSGIRNDRFYSLLSLEVGLFARRRIICGPQDQPASNLFSIQILNAGRRDLWKTKTRFRATKVRRAREKTSSVAGVDILVSSNDCMLIDRAACGGTRRC
jgi:hypothetical protein